MARAETCRKLHFPLTPVALSCSVIVCTYRRPPLLRRCLESLADLRQPPLEVVVVDNAADDATARVALAFGARYVREPQRGLSRARNTGMRSAEGEFVAFLDDDSVVDRDWLIELSAPFADMAVAAATGRILPLSVGATLSVTSELLDIGPEPFRVDRQTPGWFEMTNFGGVGFGGNMALRRSLLRGGFCFRESLGRGASLPASEESYALFQVVREGHGVAYAPRAVVRHDGPTPAERRSQERASAQQYAAYLSLLLVEEPGFRRRIGCYMLDAVLRRPQPWRRASPPAREANRIEMMIAACGGPLMYFRSRWIGG